MIRLKKILTLLALAAAVSGCARSSSRHSIKDYYLLQAERQDPPQKQKFDAVLAVDTFEVAEGFDNTSLMYRNKSGKFEADHYRRLLTDKGTALSRLTAQWLQAGGLFKLAVLRKSGIDADYRLKGIINEMYADMSDPEDRAAILKVRVFLLDNDGNVLLSEQYHTKTPIQQALAEDVVGATNQSIAMMLEQLEADIVKADF